MNDLITEWAERIRAAAQRRLPLRIRGGGSKDFYGGALHGEPLDTGAYRGILQYDPTELVLSARAGTPLAAIEAALAEQQQMLPFEPPFFGKATLGGCIAAGLSGRRRLGKSISIPPRRPASRRTSQPTDISGGHLESLG